MGILVNLRNLKSLSPSELGLKEYVLKNPRKILDLNIRDLANNTYTSASTVVRFSKKVCNGGFPQMKLQIARELNTFSENSIKLEDNILTSPLENSITTSKKLECLLNNALSETIQLIDFESIDKVADYISCYDNIDIYGIGSSYIIGSDFHYKLTRLGKETQIDKASDMGLVRARNSGEHRLSIIISYSGETTHILDIAKTLVQVGSPIVSLTSSKDCSLIQYSTECLYISSREPVLYVGAIASRTCMNYILDLIFLTYYNKNYDESSSLITKTHIDKLDASNKDNGVKFL